MSAPNGLEAMVVRPDDKAFDRLDKRIVKPEQLPEYARGKVWNRYWDILPNPDTRVRLTPMPGDPAQDYINANYVRGANGNPREYIAAQGPMKTTVGHFVRMVWEQGCTAIVMATRLQEASKHKCEPYWPPKVGETFDYKHVAVTLVKRVQCKGFLRNTLEFRCGDNKRLVEHFWFNVWPDHGVPSKEGQMFTGEVLGLLLAVRKHRKEVDGYRNPLVVHCSAGVGRTGAFIVIDHAFRLIEAGHRVNVLDIVASVRQDRLALIQHTIQYKFVCQAVYEYAQFQLRRRQQLLHTQPQQRQHQGTPVQQSGAVAQANGSKPAAQDKEGAGGTLQRRTGLRRGSSGPPSSAKVAADEKYRTVCSYRNEDNTAGVLVFEAGLPATLVKKTEHWWKMEIDGKTGWVLPECVEQVQVPEGAAATGEQPPAKRPATTAGGSRGVATDSNPSSGSASPASSSSSSRRASNPFGSANAERKTESMSSSDAASSGSATPRKGPPVLNPFNTDASASSLGATPVKKNPFAPAVETLALHQTSAEENDKDTNAEEDVDPDADANLTFEQIMDKVLELEGADAEKPVPDSHASNEDPAVFEADDVRAVPEAEVTKAKVDALSQQAALRAAVLSKEAAAVRGGRSAAPHSQSLSSVTSSKAEAEPAADTRPASDLDNIPAEPFLSSLPPWTIVLESGQITRLCDISPKFKLPVKTDPTRVLTPEQVAAPAIVAHDGTWRHLLTGLPAARRTMLSQDGQEREPEADADESCV